MTLADHRNALVVVTDGRKPRMLHLPGCSHNSMPQTKTRSPTREERFSLRDCTSCLLRLERERWAAHPSEPMTRRFNANQRLDSNTRARVESRKRDDPAARAYYERVRENQLEQHPPVEDGEHSPAQRANASQMANKALAMRYFNWP
jgi:hypothetical protein